MAIAADVLSFIKSHGALSGDASDQPSVLSVYLDGSESNPAMRHAWRERLRQFLRAERARLDAAPPREVDDFERCVTILESRLPDLHAEVKPENASVAGWMLLCAPDGEAIEARLAVAPSLMFRWAPCAILLPYLIATHAEDAVIVLIDLDHATIARLQRGIVHEVDAVSADVTVDVGPHMGDSPGAGMHTGTRGETHTESAQRQLREAHERLLSSARRKLAVIAGHESRIVVGGAAGSVAHFVATLPSEMAQRCAVSGELHMHTPFVSIPPIAHAALLDLLARRQLDALTAIDRRAHLTRNAALDFDTIQTAAAAGAVERILVTESRWERDPLAVETLCQRALRAGAQIDVVAGECATVLDERGGIAAELRYAVTVH